jgi:hypothetical protein
LLPSPVNSTISLLRHAQQQATRSSQFAARQAADGPAIVGRAQNKTLRDFSRSCESACFLADFDLLRVSDALRTEATVPDERGIGDAARVEFKRQQSYLQGIALTENEKTLNVSRQ